MPTKIRANSAAKVASAASSQRAGTSGGAGDLREVLDQLEQTQAELGALYAQLERLNRLAAMGTIAGMIAHEFNNILTPMLSYAQMAGANPNDHDLAQKAVKRTISGSERAAKIADAILSFVRDEGRPNQEAAEFHVEHSETGVHSPANAPVNRVIEDAIACMARSPGRDGIDLRLEVPAKLHVNMQPIALQQALVNIIQNARNAMAASSTPAGRTGGGGGVLTIHASHTPHPPSTLPGVIDSRGSDRSRGNRANLAPESNAHVPSCSTWNDETSKSLSPGWVTIVVQDTGRGMNRENLAQLFTPFRSDTGAVRGTGLGLIIVKRLIERAGGWMTVGSTLGQGTAVSIILPSA